MTSITITGLDELGVTADQIHALEQKLDRQGKEWKNFWEAVGELIGGNILERFINRQDHNGNYWANLMPNTLKYKTNQRTVTNNNFPDGKTVEAGILVESGDLFRSLTMKADQYSVTIGTPEEYGKYLQTGTRKMVARPFLGLSNDDKQDIYVMINDYLMGD